MSIRTGLTLGCVIGISISLEFRLPLKNLLCVPWLLLGTASPVVEPSFNNIAVHSGLLKLNLSIIHVYT